MADEVKRDRGAAVDAVAPYLTRGERWVLAVVMRRRLRDLDLAGVVVEVTKSGQIAVVLSDRAADQLALMLHALEVAPLPEDGEQQVPIDAA